MSTISEISEGFANAVKLAGVSIARVEARRWNPASGLIWSVDASGGSAGGVIVTANHVIERDEDLKVGLSGIEEALPVVLVGRDPVTDIAVLRVQADGLAPIKLKTGDFSVGELVLALGRPGHNVQASLGVIQALGGEWRTPSGARIESYVRPALVMFPGFSGGPLVDVSGQVIGMNTSGLLRNATVTLTGPTLQRVVSSLLEHGHVRRGYLGIGSQPVRLPEALAQQLPGQLAALKGQETGLLISSVEFGSPAERAGLLLGDTLVAIDNQPLAQMDDLFTFLNGDVVGKSVIVIAACGGVLQKLTLVVGER